MKVDESPREKYLTDSMEDPVDLVAPAVKEVCTAPEQSDLVVLGELRSSSSSPHRNLQQRWP